MKKNKNKLFNMIAPLYNLFFNFQLKYYTKILYGAKNVIDNSKYHSILDIGCGTGALCYVLNREGYKVTGIDAAKKMISIAEKNLYGKGIDLVHVNALEGIPFNDNSFDITIASYVLHGMKKEERKILVAEMSRVTKHRVIIHDYNGNRAFHTDIVEWLEGGDYFNFIKNVRSEMEEEFKTIQIINFKARAAWYVCTPYD